MGNIKELGQFYTNNAKDQLCGLGLDAGQVIKKWEEGAGPRLDTAVGKNLSVLDTLRRYRPGSALTLTNKFGIINFGRYPEKVLFDQFDQRSDTDSPYVLWINAYYDFNGALYKFGDQITVLHKLLRKNNFNLRFIECGDEKAIVQQLGFLRERFRPASAIIIGSHGFSDTNGIRLGVDGELEASDANKPEIQAIRNVCVSRSTIVLVSCYTGREGGLAQNLSAATDTKIVAPIYKTSLDGIWPIERNDRVDLEVEFTNDTSNRQRDYPLRGDKAVYISGQLQAA